MLKFLCIYVAIYFVYYLINKAFDGKPDKYLRKKVYDFIEINYGIVVPDDMKQNPVKYVLSDLKSMLHKKKGDDSHDEE